ncbi:hypothetical protein V1521DRAFT_432242 [Lipomyces starkeyi]
MIRSNVVHKYLAIRHLAAALFILHLFARLISLAEYELCKLVQPVTKPVYVANVSFGPEFNHFAVWRIPSEECSHAWIQRYRST